MAKTKEITIGEQKFTLQSVSPSWYYDFNDECGNTGNGKRKSAKYMDGIQVDDERNANLLRTQILRFNDELIDDKHHTREHFIEILAIIDAYEDYCRSHPDYKNNRCICAVANIKRVYNERLQKHDFS